MTFIVVEMNLTMIFFLSRISNSHQSTQRSRSSNCEKIYRHSQMILRSESLNNLFLDYSC